MGDDCHRILVPTVETTGANWSVAQAYVYVNAARDYDELKKSGTSSASLGGSYAGFGLDLDGSTSASEFQLKVRDRLVTMGFTMNEQQAETHAKTGLTDAQVQAWSACMGSGLLLRTTQLTASVATLALTYRSPPAAKSHALQLEARGGTLDGKDKLRVELTGNDSKSFLLDRSPGAKVALVTANCNGLSSDITVDFARATPTGLMGDTIEVSRRAPTRDKPYEPWTPSTVEVIALAPPVRWKAAGEEYLVLSVQKDSILFQIAHASRYADIDPTYAFDGFVISGITRQIKSVRVRKQSAPLIVTAKLVADNQVDVDLRGESPAGKSFLLEFQFD